MGPPKAHIESLGLFFLLGDTSFFTDGDDAYLRRNCERWCSIEVWLKLLSFLQGFSPKLPTSDGLLT